MTTIRISRLPEIQNDRISSDDYLIINDGDIVTSKVTFEEFVYAIGAQDIEFVGDLKYSGDIIFTGDVTGDFYNKDQTYTKAEIDQLIKNLNNYNVIQDARIVALETLTGRPTLSTDLGVFPGTIIPDNSSVIQAFVSIEEYLTALNATVDEHVLLIRDVTFRVDKLETDVDKLTEDLDDLSNNSGFITNNSEIWAALGLGVYINDDNASNHGVKEGFLYVQKNNVNDPDSTGLLKVNGLNTSTTPRA